MGALWQSFMDAPDYYEESPAFPNPVICIRDMVITGSREVVQRLPWNGVGVWLNEGWYWISQAQYNDPSAIMMPVLIAILITLFRMTLNWALFYRIPKWYNFTSEAADKFPESIFKLFYYLSAWIWGLCVVVSSRNIFFNLRAHWDEWSPSVALEPGLYWLYMTQIGFYLHCIYATLYMETIRKDFSVMMTHHVLTIGLLLFSYVIRFHVIGLLLLCILDIGDVCLEFCKTAVYFKDRGKGGHRYAEILANVGFTVFSLQYVVCRLYWFPTKVIYSAMHISVRVYPAGPYYLLFNPMLWGLFAMQAYWFQFILKMLWKIFVFGKAVEDTREYEEKKRESKKTL